MMIRFSYRLFIILVVTVLLIVNHESPTKGQQDDPESAEIEEIFEQMSVEERVGQLFLVMFPGNGVNSEVEELIRDYKVGGLILDVSSENFYNSEEPPATIQVAKFTNDLQTFAWEANSNERGLENPYFIPLFMAVDHEGNGANFVRIRSGMTTIPSQLTVGATWSDARAEELGKIVGQELASIGINMLFGPVVDVVDDPTASWRGNMGLRVFGGNPQWVGKLGRAYIRGVHDGSSRRVITVAKHFPGHGGSNRNPDDEVAVLSQTLEDLREMDLIPFFTVTETRDNDPMGVTDALMSSHIDYQRRVKGPVSLTSDEEGIGSVTQLLKEPEFSEWRENGLMVVDSLGVPAVRKYYYPKESKFPHIKIAVDALMAGNDVLTLASYSQKGDLDTSIRNVKETITFFQEEYRRNPSFMERVDEAVLKILSVKSKIFPTWSLDQVLVNVDIVPSLTGQGTDTVREIAKEAITLLYPVESPLPPPPKLNETILIATHNWNVKDCSNQQKCPTLTPLPVDALEKHMVELKQFNDDQVNSIPFYGPPASEEAGLINFLNQDTGPAETEYIQGLIDDADWIIFAILDLDWGPDNTYNAATSNYPEANTLKTFLNWYTGDAKLVVITFGTPPFNLDSTDTSKLTAYYGAYSKVEPLPEYAVRALFQEWQPHQAAPIDVGGTGYELAKQVKPDPDHTFSIQLANPTKDQLRKGETITLKTTSILDYNGHVVPDGTVLTWRGQYLAIFLIDPVKSTSTFDGIAKATFELKHPGEIEFTATSGLAASRSKKLNIAEVSSSPTAPSPEAQSSKAASTISRTTPISVATLTPSINSPQVNNPSTPTSTSALSVVSPEPSSSNPPSTLSSVLVGTNTPLSASTISPQVNNLSTPASTSALSSFFESSSAVVLVGIVGAVLTAAATIIAALISRSPSKSESNLSVQVNNDTEQLVVKLTRRLQKLKEKEAVQGYSVDPEVQLEIEDIEAKLKNLGIDQTSD